MITWIIFTMTNSSSSSIDESEQSYTRHSGEKLYDSEAQKTSFWPDYPSPSYSASLPPPHPPPSCSSIPGPQQPSELYCPRVAKRKSAHSQRPEREGGQVMGMSVYPGKTSLLSWFIITTVIHMCVSMGSMCILEPDCVFALECASVITVSSFK